MSSKDDWYRPEAHEIDLKSLGRKAVGVAGQLAKRGVDVAKREAMKGKLKGSFVLMSKAEQAQIFSLKKILADVNPGSTLAFNVQELIKLKDRETSILANLERQV